MGRLERATCASAFHSILIQCVCWTGAGSSDRPPEGHHEGEEQERGPFQEGEGERRVYGTGQDAAAAVGHYVAAG